MSRQRLAHAGVLAIGPSIRLLPADDHESVPDVENDVYM